LQRGDGSPTLLLQLAEKEASWAEREAAIPAQAEQYFEQQRSVIIKQSQKQLELMQVSPWPTLGPGSS
jgi:hypothetical protein